MKVLAFNGSPRPDGNTAILLRTVMKELEKEGIETEWIQVGGIKLQGCTSCWNCFETQDTRCVYDEDPINDWIQKMIAADGILLGSPTYVTDVTAEMKAFIDRVCLVGKANQDLFKRKIGAAVVSVRRAGAVHAFDTMNHFFTISQMIIPGSNYWNLGIGLNPGDVHRDEEGLKTMQTLGINMAWLLKKIAA